jgi:hypothetical protein
MQSHQTSSSGSSTTRQRTFQTEFLDIDLGALPLESRYPAYGFNGVVEGTLVFRRNCSYVTQVTVKVRSYARVQQLAMGPDVAHATSWRDM